MQARLAMAGVKSLSRYAALADSRQTMREFCRNTLRLDPAAGPVDIAAIIDSWEASRTRMEARHKAEAEASTLGMPMAVNRTEAQDLKRKFEQIHYAIDDKATPANSTLELVFDQVEHGEWRALLLVQFLSREDSEVEPFGAIIDKTGSVKIKKGFAETSEPKSPEELRARLKIVAHTYIMAAMKYPQKAILQAVQPHHFQRYADYLMGDQVMGLKSRDPDGAVVSSPPFSYVLAYDHQMRKEMVKQMNEGEDLVAALERARKDVNIKERYFITPASMSALTSVQNRWERSRSPHRIVVSAIGAGETGRQRKRPQRQGQGQGQEQGRQRAEAAHPHSGWERDLLWLE